MDGRTAVAAGILDRIMEALFERRLVARARLPQRPSDGVARATARFAARIQDPRGRRVGDLAVVVLVPHDPAGGATATVRWTRDAYGFWFEKTEQIGPVETAEDADLVGLGMILTAVQWTAEGSVPLRSMVRAFRRIRKAGGIAS